MTKINMPLDQWAKIPHDIWDSHWFLLSAGDYSKDEFNTMTISWGSFGTIWNRPFAMVVVRPQRYTFQFMEKYDDFSLCAFPSKYQPTLNLLGTNSGRDGDKIKESGLSVHSSKIIKAPVFSEALLQIECKKIYWDDLNPDHFIAKYIPRQYPMKDYHRMYFGEIVAIETDSSFFNS